MTAEPWTRANNAMLDGAQIVLDEVARLRSRAKLLEVWAHETLIRAVSTGALKSEIFASDDSDEVPGGASDFNQIDWLPDARDFLRSLGDKR